MAEFICCCCLKSKWKRNADNLEIVVSNANTTTTTKPREDVTDSQQIQSVDVESPDAESRNASSVCTDGINSTTIVTISSKNV